MDPYDFLEEIKRKVKRHEKKNIPVNNFTSSAILIPLIVKDNEIHIIFIERTESVRHHKGQISFPGGVCEKKDLRPVETAIRETCEELGYSSKYIKIFGSLDDYVTITGYHISPFVGHLTMDLPFKPDPVEIKEIFTTPLEHFKNSDVFEIKKFCLKDKIEDVFFFEYKDKVIWGATAKILKNFLMVIEL